MPVSDRRTLLILGGTAEARALASAAVEQFGDTLRVVTSLAGRTRDPAAVAGEMRIGGFGGVDAMADALRDEAVAMVIDATHPFATAISINAAKACAAAKVPRLLLHRPPWLPEPGDQWIDATDMAAAAVRLPSLGQCCLVTTGIKDLSTLAEVDGVRFVVRLMEPPAEALPLANATLVIARPPHDLDTERALIRDHAIDVVLTKNAGGPSTMAKLRAARDAAIPVLMIRRPDPPSGEAVSRVEDAITWIGENS